MNECVGRGHIHLVAIPGALTEPCMTELLASRSHSASADLMHSEGGGGCDVVVSGNYASRGVAKIGKTTIATL